MRKRLKDFFIPHKNNNYHPHLLHAKRAVFYSIVFLWMKIIGVVFILLLPTEVFVLPDVLASQRQAIFELTNNVRLASGLSPFVIDPRLNNSAEAKTMDMATRAYFAHTSPDNVGLADLLAGVGYSYSVAGENLAIGFSDPRYLVNAWIASPTHLANLVDKDYKDTGIGLSAGIYEGVPVVYVAQHYGVQKNSRQVPIISPVTEVESFPEEKQSSSEQIPEFLEYEEIQITNTFTDILGLKEDESVLNSKKRLIATVSTTELISFYDPEGVTVSSSTVESVIHGIDVESESVLAVDVERSIVQYSENDDMEFTITAFVPINVPFQSASISIGADVISLQDSDVYGISSGELVIHQSVDTYFQAILIPELRVVLHDGTIISAPLRWKTIPRVDQTPIEKYTSSKSLLGSFSSLYDITNGIFFFFILLFSGALLVHIFWEIHEQHHHVTAQTLGVILLLMTLLVV